MKLKQKQLHGGGLGELGGDLGHESWKWTWWECWARRVVRHATNKNYGWIQCARPRKPHDFATVKQHENEAALFKKATQRNWSWSRTIFATGKIHSTKDQEMDYVERCKMLTWPKLKVLLNKFACMASQRQNSTEWLTLPPLGHRTNRR